MQFLTILSFIIVKHDICMEYFTKPKLCIQQTFEALYSLFYIKFFSQIIGTVIIMYKSETEINIIETVTTYEQGLGQLQNVILDQSQLPLQ